MIVTDSNANERIISDQETLDTWELKVPPIMLNVVFNSINMTFDEKRLVVCLLPVVYAFNSLEKINQVSLLGMSRLTFFEQRQLVDLLHKIKEDITQKCFYSNGFAIPWFSEISVPENISPTAQIKFRLNTALKVVLRDVFASESH
jgi:hypothetical protein